MKSQCYLKFSVNHHVGWKVICQYLAVVEAFISRGGEKISRIKVTTVNKSNVRGQLMNHFMGTEMA